MRKILIFFLPIIIVIILSLPTILPLFRSGFFPMHDDTQVARVYEMLKSLKDGMFPVRWVSDLGYGYGYPIFNFYAPLAYYFGALFILLGFNVLMATKIMFISGILLAGISMYFFGKALWGDLGGVISAIFYQYATYHAVDVYVRGDVAEFWAYGIIPLVFLSLYKISTSLRRSTFRPEAIPLDVAVTDRIASSNLLNGSPCNDGVLAWSLLGGISYAALILSHNLTAMMVTPFLLAFILVIVFLSKNKLYAIRYTLYAIFLGILLSAFYWLPALSEMKFTNVLSQIGGGADYKDHFVCLQQFWYSPWGYGGSGPHCITGMSFMIGKMHILFVVILALLIISVLIIRIIPLSIILSWYKSCKPIVPCPASLSSVLSWLRDPGRVLRHSPTGEGDLLARMTFLSLIGFIISIYLQISASQFIWQHVPLMPYFQYPWRFLIMTSFFASLLAGGVLGFFPLKNNKIKFGFSTLILIFLIILQFKFFIPQKYLSVSSDYYINPVKLQWVTSKISDEYMPRGFQVPKNIKDIVLNKKVIGAYGSVKMLENKTQLLGFTIDYPASQNVLLRIAPFPAWHAYVNGELEKMEFTRNGYVLQAPPGSESIQDIVVEYDSTPIENVANLLSLSGVFLLVLGIIYFYLISRNKLRRY